MLKKTCAERNFWLLSEKYARVCRPPSNCVADAPTRCFSRSYVTIHVTKSWSGSLGFAGGCCTSSSVKPSLLKDRFLLHLPSEIYVAVRNPLSTGVAGRFGNLGASAHRARRRSVPH